jgi:1-acyl-sn-glycerol-3-phosphate acyltransferase
MVYAVIWILVLPFDRYKTITHFYTAIWARLYLSINPGWSVVIENREKLSPSAPVILVSNHQSILDIALLLQLRIKFRWVSKIELMEVPVLGWVIRMNRHIVVRRGDRQSVVNMAEACRSSLAEGIPVFMFPEGTRSVDGNLQPFKDGAFILAKETGMPILPVILLGASRALPKKGLIFRGKQQFIIRVLDEIPADTVRLLELEPLIAHTWNIMDHNLKMGNKD